MSEQQQNRELRKPGTLNTKITIAGIIIGTIILLVGLINIHTNDIVPGLVDSIVLILVWAIPGIPIGLMVFHRFKKRASSRTVIIVVAAFSGIVGGFIVAGALALCIAVWYFETHCC